MPTVSKTPETAVLLPIDGFRLLVPVSRSSIYAMIRRNELKTVWIGGRRMIPKAEADRLANGPTEAA